jgi:hypothetical protein
MMHDSRCPSSSTTRKGRTLRWLTAIPRGSESGSSCTPRWTVARAIWDSSPRLKYVARIGAARVLRLFDDYDAKATIYACGRALERNPDIARPVLDTVARAGAGSP